VVVRENLRISRRSVTIRSFYHRRFLDDLQANVDHKHGTRGPERKVSTQDLETPGE
jgi:hypothetical protein